MSAVHIAVENKDYDMLKFLVNKQYVDFNMNDVDKCSPLFYAIE